jgi:hypothetical protein
MTVRDPEIPLIEPPGAPARPSLMSRLDLRPWMAVVFSGCVGIALVSVSFGLARANSHLDAARLLFWAALAAIAGPALARMLSPSVGRRERLVVVALTALFLYWIKVLHDPVRLFFSDEFFHLANAQRIEESGKLYSENLLLPVSPDYPGLPLVTVALSKLTGLGLFASALIVIGLAKLVLSMALFLIFERVSGSARLASVGALLYCAHSNYVFWSSQFSYESLSVPLLTVALVCLLSRTGASREQRVAWTVLGCLIAVAVTLTHHLTSYALVVILWAYVGVTRVAWRFDTRPPLGMAAVATVASTAWVTVVATGTGGYLGTIFKRLVHVVTRAASEVGGTRAPFAEAPGQIVVGGTPLDNRVLAVASVLLLTFTTLAGVYLGRRRNWRDPFVLLLVIAAVAAVAAYPLRAFPFAWEIANRTSDFLFLGVAVMAAVAVVAFVDHGRRRWRVPIVAGAAVIAIAGGTVIGWPSTARLPRPFEADVGGGRVEAQGPLMADWARANLAHDSPIVANDTNGRLLSVAGFSHVWAGPTPGVRPLLTFDVIPQWQWDFLRDNGIDYLVADRRVASIDSSIGYFYPRPIELNNPLISNWLNVRRKFERLPDSRRIYDSGDIVIYDLRRAHDAKEPPPIEY